MKRLFTIWLLAAAWCAAAQTLTPDEARTFTAPKILSDEVGIRYEAQIYTGSGPGPEPASVSIDYARYSAADIGLRTGLNIFTDDETSGFLSIPLQFTWRSGRIASAWRREQQASDSSFYYGDPYDSRSHTESTDAGSAFLNLLLSILPTAFEVHAGFTPGMIFGVKDPRTQYDEVEASWQPCVIRHRFTATFDAGVRLMIPIWRFSLFGDFTYHCYLTDNFQKGDFTPSRSYMGLGAGLAFNF